MAESQESHKSTGNGMESLIMRTIVTYTHTTLILRHSMVTTTSHNHDATLLGIRT